MITSNDSNDGTTQDPAKPTADETHDKARDGGASLRQASDALQASGDTPTAHRDTTVRMTREANESIYDVASRTHSKRDDHKPSPSITVEPPGFVYLSEDDRREAVTALASLLAPLAARLIKRP